MKATGIVRRIDDLGRVVIPKEIRRSLRIREGDPLEIFTDKDGEVVFKKYSPLADLTDFARVFTEAVAQGTGQTVLVTDKDTVTAASGERRREVADRRVHDRLFALAEKRAPYVYRAGGERIPVAAGEETVFAGVVCPLVCDSDLIGSLVLLLPPSGTVPTESDVKVAQTAARLFVRQLET